MSCKLWHAALTNRAECFLLMAHFHDSVPIGWVPPESSHLIGLIGNWNVVLIGCSCQPAVCLFLIKAHTQRSCFILFSGSDLDAAGLGWFFCFICELDTSQSFHWLTDERKFVQSWRCRAPRGSCWMIFSQDGSEVSYLQLCVQGERLPVLPRDQWGALGCGGLDAWLLMAPHGCKFVWVKSALTQKNK